MTDVEEINRLLALYCQHADDGRLDDFLGLWTPDGVLHLSDRSARGRDEIAATIVGSPGFANPGSVKHLVLNVAIEVAAAGTTAEASSDFVTLRVGGDAGGIEIGWAGRNVDRFERIAGAWRVSERTIAGRL